MKQETYLQMCEQLGIPPTDAPVPYHDLCSQTQESLQIFEYCTDKWDSMNGTYLGKDLNNLEFILNTLNINKSDWSTIMVLLNNIISIRVDSVNKKMKSKMKAKKG